MSASIIKTPRRQVTFTPSSFTPWGYDYSNWVALHNPIIYKIQRIDYGVQSVTSYPVTVTILVNGVPTQANKNYLKVKTTGPIFTPDTMTVGDYVYLKSGVYNETLKVYQINSNTEFILEKVYSVNSSGGFVNLITVKENYRINIDVLGVKNNTYYVIGSLSLTPNPQGLVIANIQEWVKELQAFENDFDYLSVNKKDLNLSNTFNIRYIEEWENNSGNSITTAQITISTKMFFVNAAEQILSQYGQNMAEYVPFPDANAPKADWVCGFERPTMFRGYPFDLSFIYSDNIAPYSIKRRWREKDINGNIITSPSPVSLSPSEARFLNRLNIPEPSALCRTLETWIEIETQGSAEFPERIAASTTYVDEDYVDSYFEVVSASEDSPNPPIE